MTTVIGESPPTEQKPKRRRSTWLFVIAALLLGLATARFAVGQLRPHLYAGTVLQQSEPAAPMDQLQYASGEPVDLAAYDDEVVLVFFGYTNCPDVCPLTLSTVARTMEQLSEDDQARTNLLMVSVDPERDQLVDLQRYVGFFDDRFLGVGGPQAAIDQTATLYGIYYSLGEGDAEGGYLVDHTASLIGIDTDGALRVIWSSGIEPEALARDIEELLS